MNPAYKMLVIGNGWLGNIVADYFKTKGYEVEHFKEYINDGLNDVHPALLRNEIIVNLAGKTTIDWCEQHKESTFDANVDLPMYLADECNRHLKYFVHFSSACIFDSSTFNDWKDENSEPTPRCFYAKTKEMAEVLVSEICPYSFIPRIRLPLSEKPHPRNTIDKILKYDHINNSQESVTVIEDMLPVLEKMIAERVTGTVNLINDGTISPAEIADWFEHPYTLRTKDQQDKDMIAEGRARRVTALVRSNRGGNLPNIQHRMPFIVKAYRS